MIPNFSLRLCFLHIPLLPIFSLPLRPPFLRGGNIIPFFLIINRIRLYHVSVNSLERTETQAFKGAKEQGVRTDLVEVPQKFPVGFNIFLLSRLFILIFILLPVIFDLTIVLGIVYVVDVVVVFITWDGDLIVVVLFVVVFVSIICESFSSGLLEHVCDTVWD
jgi:hypothetical protein